eukprot:gene6200-6033_t
MRRGASPSGRTSRGPVPLCQVNVDGTTWAVYADAKSRRPYFHNLRDGLVTWALPPGSVSVPDVLAAAADAAIKKRSALQAQLDAVAAEAVAGHAPQHAALLRDQGQRLQKQ